MWILVVISIALFFAMWVSLAVGDWLARRRPDAVHSDMILNAVFALLGLLLAFTFSASFSRLDVRRHLIEQETNMIGTAYLQMDLLPEAAQPGVREQFRRYTEERARYYGTLSHPDELSASMARTNQMQLTIWKDVITATRNAELTRIIVLPSLNEMFDITTTRLVAAQTHAPRLLFVTLFMLALACAFLVGYNGRQRGGVGRVYTLVFAFVTALLVYVMLDVEYPRLGLVGLESYNQVLFDLLATMK